MQAKWVESFTQFNIAAVDDWTVIEESVDGKTAAKQPTQQPKKAVEGAKRGLRRKDDADTKMKLLKLDSMEQFKDHVISQNEDQFMEISSQKEIFAIKGLFEKKNYGRQ